MADNTGLNVRLRQSGPIPLDVDLTCQLGELMALVGPSGSGKTTILRTIAGLYRPAAGAVTCGGVTWLDTGAGIDLPPHRRRAGLVFQAYALFPHMTAFGNVTAAMAHVPASDRTTRARDLMPRPPRRPRQPDASSALWRPAAARRHRPGARPRPDVLLLDEPFSAVDRRTRRQLQSELRDLRLTLRIPIVFVTHDIGDAEAIADRLCVLDQGETVQTGRPADVLASPANARVRHALDLA